MRSLRARSFAARTFAARSLRGPTGDVPTPPTTPPVTPPATPTTTVPQSDSGASGYGVPMGTGARHYGPTAPIKWPRPARELARQRRAVAAAHAVAFMILADDYGL